VCGAAGFVPDVAVQSTDYAGVLAFVRAGAGIGLVPSLALLRTDLGGLAFAAPDPRVHRYTQALTTAPAGGSPSTDLVLAALATAAAALPSLDPEAFSSDGQSRPQVGPTPRRAPRADRW
jgi:DNA-binding transcriptional LysR family regulator